jgi:hypothetical protein
MQNPFHINIPENKNCQIQGHERTENKNCQIQGHERNRDGVIDSSSVGDTFFVWVQYDPHAQSRDKRTNAG